MFDGPASEQTEILRNNMIELLDAALAHSTLPGTDVLGWRIDAKHAQARLLTQAKFATDPRMAQQGQKLSLQYLRDCQTLILG